MSTQRIVVIVTDDTEAAEDLRHILSYAVTPPWKPIPAGENRGTYKQEPWSQEDTDRLLLDLIKRTAPKIHWMSNSIVPKSKEAIRVGKPREWQQEDDITEDDLDFARETLGADATEDEVRNLADLRADRDRGE